jgi:hypothetical protein
LPPFEHDNTRSEGVQGLGSAWWQGPVHPGLSVWPALDLGRIDLTLTRMLGTAGLARLTSPSDRGRDLGRPGCRQIAVRTSL